MFSLACQSNIGDSSLLFYFQVYGLGEMKGSFLHSVNWTRRILFNKDQPPKVVDTSLSLTFIFNNKHFY